MKPMDCKECEKKIPSFLREGLRGADIVRFKEHIDGCASCKEELTIEYLASEGIAHLESGTSFHLEQELVGYMDRALRGRKAMIFYRTGLVVYEVLALLIIALIFLFAGS